MEIDDSSQLNGSVKNSNTSINQQCENNDISASGKKGSNDSSLSGNNKLFQDRRRLRKHNAGDNNDDGGYNKEWMDIERKNIQAYEYLCHVEEARE